MTADDATSEQDPAQRSECEAIQREARQVGRTYRGMGRLNGIADTPHVARERWRERWRERITALQNRRDRYAEGWGVKLPNERLFKATGGVGQPWLQEMVDSLDAVVWQLDNEYRASTGGK